MATLTELQAFAANTSYAIPKVDFQVGAPGSTAFKSYLSLVGQNGIYYSATNKLLYVRTDGVVLDGYDFRGVTVMVEANNVTIRNSKFDATANFAAVMQKLGKSGLVVDHSSFDGLKLDKGYTEFIRGGDGKVTITYNEFINAPSDAINIRNGVVDHNYISGSGYAKGAHADAISMDGVTGPVTITNNFIDYRKPADALVEPNAALAIGNYYGDNAAISVTKNVFLGGAYTIYVQDFGTYNYSTLNITSNFVKDGLWGQLYPNRIPEELVFSTNNVLEAEPAAVVSVDVSSSEASGSMTTVVVEGCKLIGCAGKAETIVGTAGTDWLYGNGDGDRLIGAGGRDFLFGSNKGTDIFVFANVADSTIGANDVIASFQSGVDKLDLKGIGAGRSLVFIGDKAFDGTAGAVHAVKSGTSTWVEADLNGDRGADFRVEIKGAPAISAIDFLI